MGVVTGVVMIHILTVLRDQTSIFDWAEPESPVQPTKVISPTTARKLSLSLTSEQKLNPYLGHIVSCHDKTFQVSTGNLFLYNAICNVTSGNDVVQFTGSRISNLLDVLNRQLHVALPDNNKYKRWSDVSNMIMQTQSECAKQNISNRAVHLHNYHKLGDFMLLFREEYLKGGPDRSSMAKGGPNAKPLTAKQFKWAIDKEQPPIVMTNWGDENWGFLSGRKNLISRSLLFYCSIC